MKSSMLLAVSGAVLAVASPLVEKRSYETNVVTTWTTLYVTEGDKPSTMLGPGEHKKPSVTTTSTKVPVPEPTYAAAPAPTTAPPKPAVYQTKTQPPPPPPKKTSYKTAPTSTKKSSPEPTDYASTGLYHHNLHRANHSAPALDWSDAHASYAALTASKCVFKHDLGPGGGGYGQNLAMWASSSAAKSLGANKALAQGITNMWYNGELKKYPAQNYGKSNPDMSNFEGWGHFSQLVWAGSSKVGCHTQYCPAGTMNPSMGAWFTVCNYHPAGNVGGAYGKNVLPPLGQHGFSA